MNNLAVSTTALAGLLSARQDNVLSTPPMMLTRNSATRLNRFRRQRYNTPPAIQPAEPMADSRPMNPCEKPSRSVIWKYSGVPKCGLK